MDKILRCLNFAPVLTAAILFSMHCNGFPKKGDFPVTMSQVREGAPVYTSPPQPAPEASKRSLPVAIESDMEVAVIGGLHYRAQPGLGGKILGTIPYQSKITVLDRSAAEGMRGVKGKWFKISFAGETGYVNSKYLRALGEKRSMQASPNRARKKRTKKTPEAITNVQR